MEEIQNKNIFRNRNRSFWTGFFLIIPLIFFWQFVFPIILIYSFITKNKELAIGATLSTIIMLFMGLILVVMFMMAGAL